MTTFKITNITNLLGKRGVSSNSILEAEYVDEMIKKTIKIKPQETIYLTLNSLPLSIHRLRIKGLVTVNEISKKELKAILATERVKKTKITEEINKKESKIAEEISEEEEKIVDIKNSEEVMEEKNEKKISKKPSKKSAKDDIEKNEVE